MKPVEHCHIENMCIYIGAGQTINASTVVAKISTTAAVTPGTPLIVVIVVNKKPNNATMGEL